MDLTGIIWLSVMAAAVVLWFLHWARVSRCCEYRIREWARENGYAVLSIRYQRLFPWVADIIFLPLGKFFPGRYPFKVGIQDDQGGQTTVTIFFNALNGPIEVHWGE